MNNIKWQAAREAQCLSKLAAYDSQTLITNNTNKKETIQTLHFYNVSSPQRSDSEPRSHRTGNNTETGISLSRVVRTLDEMFKTATLSY